MLVMSSVLVAMHRADVLVLAPMLVFHVLVPMPMPMPMAVADLMGRARRLTVWLHLGATVAQ